MKAQGRLPNLIVIGGHKCGTTSMHYYLDQHPQIRMSKHKELNFFANTSDRMRTLDWYRSQFSALADVRGESSPIYADHPRTPGVPERMHQVLPDARLIYLVRDPIRRIVSHYTHWYTTRQEHGSLSEAIAKPTEGNPYINRSRYHLQMQQYLAFYDQKDILIIASEDLRDARVETMAAVFRFLGVDPDFASANFRHVKHQSREKRRLSSLGQTLHDLSYRHMNPAYPAAQRLLTRWVEYPLSRSFERPQLTSEQREYLNAELHPDVERLRALTGHSFSRWSI